MNSFERQAHEPPPPSPFVVLGRHGDKFRVRAYGHTRIMTRQQVIKFASSTKRAGGMVQLAGLINPAELDA